MEITERKSKKRTDKRRGTFTLYEVKKLQEYALH